MARTLVPREVFEQKEQKRQEEIAEGERFKKQDRYRLTPFAGWDRLGPGRPINRVGYRTYRQKVARGNVRILFFRLQGDMDRLEKIMRERQSPMKLIDQIEDMEETLEELKNQYRVLYMETY